MDKSLPAILYCLFIAGLLMLFFRGRVFYPWAIIMKWKFLISLAVFSVVTTSWWLGGVPRYLVPLEIFLGQKPLFLTNKPFEVVFFFVNCLIIFLFLYELDENAKKTCENNPQINPEESSRECEIRKTKIDNETRAANRESTYEYFGYVVILLGGWLMVCSCLQALNDDILAPFRSYPWLGFFTHIAVFLIGFRLFFDGLTIRNDLRRQHYRT